MGVAMMQVTPCLHMRGRPMLYLRTYLLFRGSSKGAQLCMQGGCACQVVHANRCCMARYATYIPSGRPIRFCHRPFPLRC